MYQRFWLENLKKKITQCDYRTLWRHNLNGWEIYSIHRYDLCVVYLFKWQRRNVVLWLGHQEDAGDVMCLYFRPSQLMAAPHTVVDCLDFDIGQFVVAACYRIRKYFDINPITILLFLHCIFLSLKAHIFNFVPYICNVSAISFFTGCPPKASQQPGVNKGVSYWTNSLKR